MAMTPKDHADDLTATMLAITHHIQNRILRAAASGRMSEGVSVDIKAMAAQLVQAADRLAKAGA